MDAYGSLFLQAFSSSFCEVASPTSLPLSPHPLSSSHDVCAFSSRVSHDSGGSSSSALSPTACGDSYPNFHRKRRMGETGVGGKKDCEIVVHVVLTNGGGLPSQTSEFRCGFPLGLAALPFWSQCRGWQDLSPLSVPYKHFSTVVVDISVITKEPILRSDLEEEKMLLRVSHHAS